MAVDLRSVARAAAEAALGDVAPEKKGLSPWWALAIGAGLVTAGRIATGPGGRFVRELVQGHSSNGSAEDEEPEAEQGEEPEADGRRRARSRSRRRARSRGRRRARSREPTTSPKPKPTTSPKPKPTTSPKPKPTTSPKPEPTTSPKPIADHEPDAEQDERTEGEAEGGRPGRPRHPLFEQALAPEAAQRRDSESPKEPQTERATDSAAATAEASTHAGSTCLINHPVWRDTPVVPRNQPNP